MTTDKDLDKLKKTYLATEPSHRLVKFGWANLEALLEKRKTPEPALFAWQAFPRFLIFAAVVLLVAAGAFLGLAKVAQAALPGEPLYPVKRWSENIISVVSPRSYVKVENRAREILDISKGQKESKFLDKTVEEYQKAVQETRKEISPSSRRGREFRQKLGEQEEQFREMQKSGSGSGTALEEAVEAAREGRSGSDGGGGDDRRDGGENEEEIKIDGKTDGEGSSGGSGSNSGSH